jgi:hypothetical protein
MRSSKKKECRDRAHGAQLERERADLVDREGVH